MHDKRRLIGLWSDTIVTTPTKVRTNSE